jgi:hypothetical protein
MGALGFVPLPRSAMANTVALVFAAKIEGMTDASATRRRRIFKAT